MYGHKAGTHAHTAPSLLCPFPVFPGPYRGARHANGALDGDGLAVVHLGEDAEAVAGAARGGVGMVQGHVDER